MSIKLKRTDEEMRWKTLSSEYIVKAVDGGSQG